MKIVCIIPARYQSSRFPGKPLADICGKPMIQRVYEQVKKVKELEDIYVATDDERIEKVCKENGMNVIMTRNDHQVHVCRLQEVSEKISADYYVCVCGDEPLIDPETIRAIIPQPNDKKYYARSLMRDFSDPAEVIDPANIKVTTTPDGDCIGLSRSPIPYPYKTVLFKYQKVVGVECFTKEALDFFANTPKGTIEKIEDIALLRYLEHGKLLNYKKVSTIALSVDTPRDLEKVIHILKEQGELK